MVTLNWTGLGTVFETARSRRRATAIVLSLFLAFFQVEGLIPDICDGDATPVELLSFSGGASDLPSTTFAVARAAVEKVSTGASSEGVPLVGGLTAGAPASGGDGTAPGSPHATHACHCVHSHGGTLAAISVDPPRIATVAGSAARVRYAAPASVTEQPPLRPPLG
ncbi:MAG: hypothetical protein ABIP93_19565 [Gemmatimonadaceae bacterium]